MSKGFELEDKVTIKGCVLVYNISKFITYNTVQLRYYDTVKTSSIDNLIPVSNKFKSNYILTTNMGDEIYDIELIEYKTCKEIRDYFKKIVKYFNDTLKRDEEPRKFIRVKRKVIINKKEKFVKV